MINQFSARVTFWYKRATRNDNNRRGRLVANRNNLSSPFRGPNWDGTLRRRGLLSCRSLLGCCCNNKIIKLITGATGSNHPNSASGPIIMARGNFFAMSSWFNPQARKEEVVDC